MFSVINMIPVFGFSSLGHRFFPSSVPLVMFNRPVLKRNCTFELIVRFESEIMFTMLSEINMIPVFFWFIKSRFWSLIPVSALL